MRARRCGRHRVRGTFRTIDASLPDEGKVGVTDVTVTDGATEFSLPRIAVYAVIDMK